MTTNGLRELLTMSANSSARGECPELPLKESWYLHRDDLPQNLVEALSGHMVIQNDALAGHRGIIPRQLLASVYFTMRQKQLLLDTLPFLSSAKVNELNRFFQDEEMNLKPALAQTEPARLLRLSAEQILGAFALAAYHGLYPEVKDEEAAIANIIAAKAQRCRQLKGIIARHADWNSPVIAAVYGAIQQCRQPNGQPEADKRQARKNGGNSAGFVF